MMGSPQSPCARCGQDRRYCLVQGWVSRRDVDGRVEIRFDCPALQLRLAGPRSGAVAWTLAVADADGRFGVRERGYTRRLLDAARDLADALRRADLAGWATTEQIAVAIVVAESRARHAIAARRRGRA
mgnify:CR=1 FL=1|jgi:hypothetical protein